MSDTMIEDDLWLIRAYTAEMRALGITQLVFKGVEITLGAPKPEPIPDTKADEERVAHEKPGPDGLTPSEQAMLYGSPYETGE